ncbi:MAG TPA: hypothetical protein VKE70_13455 [Candidatus Solibacter sp.]|nr:hypothetical protein [Candidatus Solibacter sp.]
MRKMFGIGVCLVLALAPQLAAAVAGCNNGYLVGYYNAEVTNLNLQNTLQSLNNPGGSTVTPAGGTATPAVIGFGSNPRSISGALPGASRFFFDGAGMIVGVSTASNGSTFSSQAGSYTVNTDCTATLSLNGGATFDAVLADSGKQIVFVETDSSAMGAVGRLQKASSCVNLNYPQNYAFSFSGAAAMTGAATSGGATGSTPAATTFGAFSEIGTFSTDGNGNFSLSQTTIANGTVTRSKGGGTYTIGADCSLKLSFSSSFPGTTANFKAPSSLNALSSDFSGGVLVQQNDANTVVTGTFIVQ